VRSNIKAVKNSVAFPESRNLFKQLWNMAVIALFISAPFHAAAQTSYKLDFVSDKPEAGYTQVHPDMEYNDERGFGFEPGSSVCAGDGFVIGDSTCFFSVAVPEGNYRVQVTFGDPDAESVATVKAELRRLMIEEVKVSAGRTTSRTFTVNVKTPAISTGGQVRLKGQREAVQEAFNWDGKLNLQFSNSHPALRRIEIEKVNVPTIFILGDSTSTDQMADPYSSWGQSITAFFKPEIAVANHGESGESMAGAVGARRTDKIYDSIKPGDFLLIQFGHNDMKSNAPNALQIFEDGLMKAVEEARKLGATPVLVTPVSRRTFQDGKITNSFVTRNGDDYLAAVKKVARQTLTPLIDLNAMSAMLYETFGTERAQLLFAHPVGLEVDGTHHNDFGSYEIAKCVLQGIRDNNLAIAKFIVNDFKGFDPSNPDKIEEFKLPRDIAVK
jgi:lysophospholipase L1-like esterase